MEILFLSFIEASTQRHRDRLSICIVLITISMDPTMLSFFAYMGALSSAIAEEPVPTIPFETYKLENGLNVILSQDKSIPFVQVNLWYNVGSKDETPGLSGFAHLFEHLKTSL